MERSTRGNPRRDIVHAVIDQAVSQRAAAFRNAWEPVFAAHREIDLAPTWLLPATADCLCWPLRYREDWSPAQREFVGGLAACLGELVDGCWRLYSPDVRTTLGPDGVVCNARERVTWLRREVNRLPIEDNLTAILQKPVNPFPAFGKQYVFASDATNLLGVWGLGACLGMSSYGEGPWSEKLPGDLKEHIDRGVPHLARTTADYFRRTSDEPVLADASLYERQMIWPPGGYHGDYGGITAARGIVAHEKEKGVLSHEALWTLARCAEPTLSAGAVVALLSRITAAEAPRGLAEVTFSFAHEAPAMRAAINDLSRENGTELDWLVTGDRDRFEFERRFHMLPAVWLPWEVVTDPSLRPLVEALLAFDTDKAHAELDRLDRREPWLAFQKAMLHKVRGQWEPAQEILRLIDWRDERYSRADFLGESGMNCLNVGDVAGAVRLLDEARREPGGERYRGNYVWALMSAQRLDEAMGMLGDLPAASDMPVTDLLNRQSILRQRGETAAADRDLDEALRIRPFDRRALANVVMPRLA